MVNYEEMKAIELKKIRICLETIAKELRDLRPIGEFYDVLNKAEKKDKNDKEEN